METAMRGIEASWLWSGEASDAPLAGGALVVGETGVVVQAGAGRDLRERFADTVWERHEGVLVPGLVNARVCLELSALRGRVNAGGGLVPWLRELVSLRERISPERDRRAIDRAVDDLVRAGTAAVGEVTTSLAALDSLARAPLVARVFREVAGMRSETASVVRAMALEDAETVGARRNLALELAPHSLIGLHPQHVAALCDAADAPVPLALAWSAAERAFLDHGGGPFAEWILERSADAPDWAPPKLAPIDRAAALSVLGPRLIATHLADARAHELRALALSGTRTVLCPRASLRIEGALPALDAILAMGLTPGLGTDSLAAAASLDVLDEAAMLATHFPAVPAAVLLAMATSWGARALALDHLVGSFAPGRAPGVLLFRWSGAGDPLRDVLAQAGRERRVLVAPGSVLP
jgi:aminodeoxyfutalosine deaminase